MIKRAIYISSPLVLKLKSNQMILRTKDEPDIVKSIPIEDIGYVIFEEQQSSITLPLLNALSNNNVAVIFCNDVRMPNAMLLNLNSNSIQGERYKNQLSVSGPLKKNLWKQIIESKIRNQAALLNKLGKDGSKLRYQYSNVKSGDTDNREGIAAKIYWNELFGENFIRNRDGSPPNSLLNYGYTILRAAVTRALMGSGLFPAFGIFHKNRYNAFPLADDIMEPYRPYVDEIVFKLFDSGKTDLDKETKAELLRILFIDTQFSTVMRPLDIALTMTSASLAKCFAGTQKKISYPLLN